LDITTACIVARSSADLAFCASQKVAMLALPPCFGAQPNLYKRCTSCRATEGDSFASSDAAGNGAIQPSRETASASIPWQLSSYYTKKLERRTDALGNMIASPDSIAAAPGWTPDAQLRLAAEALAPSLHQDAEALLEQASTTT
jgi:hypothetical protein